MARRVIAGFARLRDASRDGAPRSTPAAGLVMNAAGRGLRAARPPTTVISRSTSPPFEWTRAAGAGSAGVTDFGKTDHPRMHPEAPPRCDTGTLLLLLWWWSARRRVRGVECVDWLAGIGVRGYLP